jgi:hypothetical protein
MVGQTYSTNRARSQPTLKGLVKGHTVIPREVGKRLKLKRGDTLRCRLVDDGILLGNSTEASDEPFAAFWEWTSEAAAKAYAAAIAGLELRKEAATPTPPTPRTRR